MRLLGREVTAEKVVARIEARLRERGLLEEKSEPIQIDRVEPRVDPLSFNLRALEENQDPTVGLPLHTHRTGMGQAVLLAKWAFRKGGKVFISELLGRQRVFNAHVLDSYAQLSAEVLRLREEVARLKRMTEAVTVAPAQVKVEQKPHATHRTATTHAAAKKSAAKKPAPKKK